mgnify:CR=1 FL=1
MDAARATSSLCTRSKTDQHWLAQEQLRDPCRRRRSFIALLSLCESHHPRHRVAKFRGSLTVVPRGHLSFAPQGHPERFWAEHNYQRPHILDLLTPAMSGRWLVARLALPQSLLVRGPKLRPREAWTAQVQGMMSLLAHRHAPSSSLRRASRNSVGVA